MVAKVAKGIYPGTDQYGRNELGQKRIIPADSIRTEAKNLSFLSGCQSTSGIALEDQYTPRREDLIEEEGETVLLMEFVPGVPLPEVKEELGDLEQNQVLSMGIQMSHLFSAVEDYSLVSMGKDFQLINIFVDRNNKNIKVKLIDWSLGHEGQSHNTLEKNRKNERYRISEAMVHGLLHSRITDASFDRVKAGEDSSKMYDYLEIVKKFSEDPGWAKLDNRIRYIILKGLGVLEQFPDGYASHREMLQDLLKAAKSVDLSEDMIPPVLREGYKKVEATGPEDIDVKLAVVEKPKETPLPKKISFDLDLTRRYPATISSHDIFSSKDYTPYTPSEIIRFLSSCKVEDFAFLKGRDDQNFEKRGRVVVARVFATDYFLKELSIRYGGGINEHKQMKETLLSDPALEKLVGMAKESEYGQPYLTEMSSFVGKLRSSLVEKYNMVMDEYKKKVAEAENRKSLWEKFLGSKNKEQAQKEAEEKDFLTDVYNFVIRAKEEIEAGY